MLARKSALGFVPVVLVAFLATAVLAANAHFVSASARRSGNDLLASFKEAGLGDTTTVTVVLQATSTANYACFNNGGHNPAAQNKRTVVSDVSVSGQFTSGKNGSVSGSLRLSPAGPGSFSCPGGQHLVLQSASYSNVRIVDTTSGASIGIPGTF